LVQKAYARGQFEISRLLQTQRTVFEANIDYISALEKPIEFGRRNRRVSAAGSIPMI